MREISTVDRDRLILRIVEKIRSDKQKIASPERLESWSIGWAENYDAYVKSNGDLASLIPRFIRHGEPIRWFSKYFSTEDPYFELNYISVLRSFITEMYLSEIDSLYEFGAGTGFNLVHFGQLRPELNLIGTDFVESSVKLINEIANRESIKIKSQIFDMLEPVADKLVINPNSGILTFGSLEQLGSSINPVLQYFLTQRPKVCIHIEPMIEMYNTEILEDYLAAWFQGQRGYSFGLIHEISELEKRGKAKILKLQRLNFGSLMMEGYNLLVWKPI